MRRHKTIARTFTALSHPRRVRIFETLQSLQGHKANFGELGRLTRIPAAPLAHHLDAMRAAGLVRRRDKGRYSEFSLCLQPFAQVVQNVTRQSATSHRVHPKKIELDLPLR